MLGALFVVCFAVLGPLAEASCGRRPSGARVVGGEEAVPNSWPWQLSLRKYGRHNCGASLITPEWAVTAGHCVRRSLDPNVYSVLAGAHSRYNDGTEYKISKVILHKDYSHVFNDVALLKLEKPAVLNDKVGTICLPKQGDRLSTGKMCWMTGWGRYDPNSNSGSPKLKQTFVPIADHQTCRKVNGGSVRESTMVCAGGKGTSVCNGDSGGPLSCEENGRWVLRGAASWVTDRKCPGDTYSVYARVSEFIDWIYNNMKDTPAPTGPPSPRPPPPHTPPSPNSPPPPPQPTTRPPPGGCFDSWGSRCRSYQQSCRLAFVKKACKKTCKVC